MSAWKTNALRERKMSEIQLPEAFLKLGEVLEQGQFELLFTEEKLRLVYFDERCGRELSCL